MTGTAIHKLDYEVRCTLAEITRKDGSEWVTPNAPLEDAIMHQEGASIAPIDILLAWATGQGYEKFADIVQDEVETDPTKGFVRTIEVLGDDLGDATFTAEVEPQAAWSIRMLFEIEVFPLETIHSPPAGRA